MKTPEPYRIYYYYAGMKYEEWRSFGSEIEMLRFIKTFSSEFIVEMRIGHSKQTRSEVDALLRKAKSQ
jgi:hypothetical protein